MVLSSVCDTDGMFIVVTPLLISLVLVSSGDVVVGCDANRLLFVEVDGIIEGVVDVKLDVELDIFIGVECGGIPGDINWDTKAVVV